MCRILLNCRYLYFCKHDSILVYKSQDNCYVCSKIKRKSNYITTVRRRYILFCFNCFIKNNLYNLKFTFNSLLKKRDVSILLIESETLRIKFYLEFVHKCLNISTLRESLDKMHHCYLKCCQCHFKHLIA